MDLVISAIVTGLGFVAVGLMAYFAVRPEKPGGPICPRCLSGVRAGAPRCRACKQPLDWTDEEG